MNVVWVLFHFISAMHSILSPQRLATDEEVSGAHPHLAALRLADIVLALGLSLAT
jgi:hypothetical protein